MYTYIWMITFRSKRHIPVKAHGQCWCGAEVELGPYEALFGAIDSRKNAEDMYLHQKRRHMNSWDTAKMAEME
jgi:hypothetical protein